MKRNLTTRTIARCACTGLAMLLVAACSSSSASGPSTSTGDGGGGGGGGSDVCTTVSQADVQALLVPSITKVNDNSGVDDCDFVTSAATQSIVWYPSDADKTDYMTLTAGASDHQISGIGDEAYWNEPSPGVTLPQLSAHKGNATCVIQPVDPPNSTCKTTSAGGVSYTVADSDATAFVTLMGKVCNDVFAAL